MSLLTNYEGLRHQIEKLVRENEELKKLVRLIRENYELKSAIKTQAGGLGISGFSSGLSEAAASASPHQGVFLPPSPAATNEPILEEVGIVALAPLADVLNSPQPSPVAGPIVSPLAGPLNTLLPSPGPISQSSPLTSHLASPLTSTPVGVPGTPGPVTAFSYGTSDAQTQPGGPQGQVVPASVPVLTASNMAILTSAPTPTPPVTTSYTPSSTPHPSARTHHSPSRPSLTPHSPPRNPRSPPRTSSSPASVTDTRGPRGPEQSRKSILELERKLAHRKSSKFPDSSRESKQLAWERLVGEIAFQLDRRILSSIFPERVRLYGFTVSNIPEKIIQASLNPSDHKLDEELCQTLTQRYVSIMNRLQSLGYNGRVHPALTEQLVNAYGILRERPELAASEGGSYTVDFLQRVLVETVHPSMLTDALLLLSCLSQLAHDDGKPMFIW
ncbi:hypothetical protein MG293_010358 [Ovis ammon polii]|uniref:Spermatogenesis and centriole associated 1 n=1 Tax=Ovis ammon polii TaxID=230172 RepID=A0AAD4U5R5_OVIAM|nr:hypothetical protein MG293_010358 [Ovis ammon polii]